MAKRWQRLRHRDRVLWCHSAVLPPPVCPARVGAVVDGEDVDLLLAIILAHLLVLVLCGCGCACARARACVRA